MQTNLAAAFQNTPEGLEAEAILRACVHCGFCTATCPTYQLLGDELDGPRGRIYLIKQVMEGAEPTAKTQAHLDRCLTCRSCESTCPSGVKYGRLVDIGRHVVDAKVQRPLGDRLRRRALRGLMLNKPLFSASLALGRLMRPLLPKILADKISPARAVGDWPINAHPRRLLILEGCVQPAMNGNIDAAAARVLDLAGIQLVRIQQASCCGAVNQHMDAPEAALAQAKCNIDLWTPHLDAGTEGLVITASGCSVMVKDYGYLLQHDPAYAARAARVSALCRDISEIIVAEWAAILPKLNKFTDAPKLAYHPPCSLQHGMQLRGWVEGILRDVGYQLTSVSDSHLCCGSAGTYSVLQPTLSNQLKANKVAALQAGVPSLIATSNIGCLAHLQSGTDLQVRHWIELLDNLR